MQAIQIAHTGGPEVMVLRELPTPAHGPGQALVRIEACGVNFIDVYQRDEGQMKRTGAAGQARDQ